jgi:hypothetical protein
MEKDSVFRYRGKELRYFHAPEGRHCFVSELDWNEGGVFLQVEAIEPAEFPRPLDRVRVLRVSEEGGVLSEEVVERWRPHQVVM